ncbi:hypothetical protein ALP29_201636 [Pseudomonas syringae pv. avii]|uniref:Uncharacterized protein n=1 Tax=Pseudomonas syringae pv. avii TaxID=663959 RepID=A0A3M5V4J8_PSESX|nr:hypothetical protein ALP29_201636 [Pseudomonas syringae pv. avii]
MPGRHLSQGDQHRTFGCQALDLLSDKPAAPGFAIQRRSAPVVCKFSGVALLQLLADLGESRYSRCPPQRLNGWRLDVRLLCVRRWGTSVERRVESDYIIVDPLQMAGEIFDQARDQWNPVYVTTVVEFDLAVTVGQPGRLDIQLGFERVQQVTGQFLRRLAEIGWIGIAGKRGG